MYSEHTKKRSKPFQRAAKLAPYLDAYIDAAGIRSEKGTPLFRTLDNGGSPPNALVAPRDLSMEVPGLFVGKEKPSSDESAIVQPSMPPIAICPRCGNGTHTEANRAMKHTAAYRTFGATGNMAVAAVNEASDVKRPLD